MLDVVAVVTLALLFGLAVLYTHGCDRLKGVRP
jgi:hypothetical protein